tara:strand:- start:776 stop:1195 length:420 start_codon:yes stop_codon:yes gene_type:complete
MANSNYEKTHDQRNSRNNFEGNKSSYRNKYGGNRDGGGFRIRLSENEMQSVKTIQESFQLKSTVAVLGFSIRTLSVLIKDEKIRTLITQIANNKNSSDKNYVDESKQKGNNSVIDPFARPEKKRIIEESKNNQELIDEK